MKCRCRRHRRLIGVGEEMKPRGVEICRLGDRGGGNPELIHMKLLLVKDLELMGLIWRFFPFTYRTMDRSALLLQVDFEMIVVFEN